MKKNSLPKVKSFTATINLSLPEPIFWDPAWDIQTWEKLFISKTNKEKYTIDIQDEYNTCRSTMKWARRCGASIASVQVASTSFEAGTLEFTFAFDDIRSLANFIEFFKERVNWILNLRKFPREQSLSGEFDL